jgi:hypothetical protein
MNNGFDQGLYAGIVLAMVVIMVVIPIFTSIGEANCRDAYTVSECEMKFVPILGEK